MKDNKEQLKALAEQGKINDDEQLFFQVEDQDSTKIMKIYTKKGKEQLINGDEVVDVADIKVHCEFTCVLDEDNKITKISNRRSHKNCNIFSLSKQVLDDSDKHVNTIMTALFKCMQTQPEQLKELLRMLNMVMIHHLAEVNDIKLLEKLIIFSDIDHSLYLAPIIMSKDKLPPALLKDMVYVAQHRELPESVLEVTVKDFVAIQSKLAQQICDKLQLVLLEEDLEKRKEQFQQMFSMSLLDVRDYIFISQKKQEDFDTIRKIFKPRQLFTIDEKQITNVETFISKSKTQYLSDNIIESLLNKF